MNQNIVSLKLERDDLKVIATYLNKLHSIMVKNGSINKIEVSYCECTVVVLITKHARISAKKHTLKMLKYDALLLSEMLQKVNPHNLYAKSLFLGIIGEIDKQTA